MDEHAPPACVFAEVDSGEELVEWNEIFAEFRGFQESCACEEAFIELFGEGVVLAILAGDMGLCSWAEEQSDLDPVGLLDYLAPVAADALCCCE